MERMSPSMRLKVLGDTWYVADDSGNVYVRNNQRSFRMEGKSIQQWIEKLLPVFNGKLSMREITDGLPEPYQNRIYDIASVFYENGFARDVSQDHPHQLATDVTNQYAAQIEFLDNMAASGAYRFQTYRSTQVLVIGHGPFFVSLVRALLESGIIRVTVLNTKDDSAEINKARHWIDEARQTDREVTFTELTLEDLDLKRKHILQPFDVVLYVSPDGDVESLRRFESLCKLEQKWFIASICVGGVGLVGPIVQPDGTGAFDAMWRRLHEKTLYEQTGDKKFNPADVSSTAYAVLSNILVFELLKAVTRLTDLQHINEFYLLNLETLEGEWHGYVPYPVDNQLPTEMDRKAVCARLKADGNVIDNAKFLTYFGSLTGSQAGIFHEWGEADLTQLPLAQCRVQVACSDATGPARLLPATVCGCATHERARLVAGLTGIEDYARAMAAKTVAACQPSGEYIGVGAGSTFAEAVWRGLHQCLLNDFRQSLREEPPVLTLVDFGAIEDVNCRFYMQTLQTLQIHAVFGLGEQVYGFPTVWIGIDGSWVASVGRGIEDALQAALEHVLIRHMNADAGEMNISTPARVVSSHRCLEYVAEPVVGKAEHATVQVRPVKDVMSADVVFEALDRLQKIGKEVVLHDLAMEPFLQETLAGVVGVTLREGEGQ